MMLWPCVGFSLGLLTCWYLLLCLAAGPPEHQLAVYWLVMHAVQIFANPGTYSRWGPHSPACCIPLPSIWLCTGLCRIPCSRIVPAICSMPRPVAAQAFTRLIRHNLTEHLDVVGPEAQGCVSSGLPDPSVHGLGKVPLFLYRPGQNSRQHEA